METSPWKQTFRKYLRISSLLICLTCGALTGEIAFDHYSGNNETDIVKRINKAQLHAILFVSSKTNEEKVDSEAQRLLIIGDYIALDKLIARWVTVSPYSALEWALRLKKPANVEAMRSVLLAWMAKEPDEAFDWASKLQHDAGLFNDNRFYEVVVNAGRPDLGIKAIDCFINKQFVLQEFISQWASADSNAVKDYLAQPMSRPDWVVAASAYTSVLAATDTDAALAWIQANAEALDEKQSLLESVAKGLLANDDIQGAIDLANAASNDGSMKKVDRAIAQYYGSSDPEAAFQWLQSANDPQLISGTFLAVSEIANSRPDLAVQLLEEVPDQTLRDFRLQNVITKWAQTDPTAALAYVAQSNALSTAARQALLTNLGQPNAASPPAN